MTLFNTFHQLWFPKWRSLTSSNPTFSLFWAHNIHFFTMLSISWLVSMFMKYNIIFRHVRHFCLHLLPIFTIIWPPYDDPYTTNHSFYCFEQFLVHYSEFWILVSVIFVQSCYTYCNTIGIQATIPYFINQSFLLFWPIWCIL